MPPVSPHDGRAGVGNSENGRGGLGRSWGSDTASLRKAPPALSRKGQALRSARRSAEPADMASGSTLLSRASRRSPSLDDAFAEAAGGQQGPPELPGTGASGSVKTPESRSLLGPAEAPALADPSRQDSMRRSRAKLSRFFLTKSASCSSVALAQRSRASSRKRSNCAPLAPAVDVPHSNPFADAPAVAVSRPGLLSDSRAFATPVTPAQSSMDDDRSTRLLLLVYATNCTAPLSKSPDACPPAADAMEQRLGEDGVLSASKLPDWAERCRSSSVQRESRRVAASGAQPPGSSAPRMRDPPGGPHEAPELGRQPLAPRLTKRASDQLPACDRLRSTTVGGGAASASGAATHHHHRPRSSAA